MKWLSELVESSHSSLEVLPVPCLCEFLMASYQDQLSGGHSAGDGDTDPSSHRAHYKRKKNIKDKVEIKSHEVHCTCICILISKNYTFEDLTHVLVYIWVRIIKFRMSMYPAYADKMYGLISTRKFTFWDFSCLLM